MIEAKQGTNVSLGSSKNAVIQDQNPLFFNKFEVIAQKRVIKTLLNHE